MNDGDEGFARLIDWTIFGKLDGRMEKWTDSLTNRLIDWWMNGWMDRALDVWMV